MTVTLKPILRDFYHAHLRKYRPIRAVHKVYCRTAPMVRHRLRLWKGALAWHPFYMIQALPVTPAVLAVNAQLLSPSCRIYNLAQLPADLRNEVTLSVEPVTYRQITDVTAFGSSDVLRQGKTFYYTQQADLRRHLLSEQAKYFMHVCARDKKVFLYRKTEKIDPVREAFHLLGATTPNYVHWLTEYLPRLLLFEDAGLTSPVLLLDQGLPSTIRESVTALARSSYQVVEVPPYFSCSIDHMHYVDTGSFVPFGYRDDESPAIRDDETKFSSAALQSLRHRCAERILNTNDDPSGQPRKLLVLRNSTFRAVLNQKELVTIAARFGYQTVTPEQLSFVEQVRLFSTATHIIGQTGAGIGNFLFAPPGCKIVLFAANLGLGNYRYFHNIAQLCGHELSFIAGKPTDVLCGHTDFEVDLACLTDVLRQQDDGVVSKGAVRA